MSDPLPHFEKLGVFYLGKEYDLREGDVEDDYLLYDSKDLTTHAVCVGMTGSGKTGLCLSLLEEAAIDSIPAIAIDPKGDLGNLFLTFPDLKPEDFRPWVDESAATRKGVTPDEFAKQTAKLWRDGLGKWDQDAARIARFRDAVDMAIYTPGSSAGIPMTVLRSFSAPPAEVLNDTDLYRERISASASGLLALLGIDADPIRSREHILLSNILDHAWREGRDLDIASLIREIQMPPFDRVGIIDLETFFPEKDRTKFSLSLNNLLASPAFHSWLEGETLDVKKLLYTDEGKPRLSVISIAHLSEAERMFFVTILLNEVLSWVRTQPGTSSLRALLYMDEVFGYFPPVAEPPSKRPMLTLLKQARAYGLGVVLATQNPVDLDYKGLSNTGTWFIGRLQTERDKLRVLEGLEGASAQAGSNFDRAEMEAILAGLGSRVFLMNNVHDDQPVTFHTRWALSYLRGPLTRLQIQELMAPLKASRAVPARTTKPKPAPLPAPKTSKPVETAKRPKKPKIPDTITQQYLAVTIVPPADGGIIYRPGLLGSVRLHFVRSTYKLDQWETREQFTVLPEKINGSVWSDSVEVGDRSLDVDRQPAEAAGYFDQPSGLTRKTSYTSWEKQLREHLYRAETVTIYKCELLKEYSRADETEGEFRVRLRHKAHEQRDLEVEKLRGRYESKMRTLRDRIKSAERRLDEERAQATRAGFSFGAGLLGAIFGRRRSTSAHSNRATEAWEQREDVKQARKKLEDYKRDYRELERDFEADVKALEEKYDAFEIALEELKVRPRKSDIQSEDLTLVWVPWVVYEDGSSDPAFELIPPQP